MFRITSREEADPIVMCRREAAGFPDRIVGKAGHEADLKKRTLTNLYNVRPTWLVNLHKELDTAVAQAYGWQWPMNDDDIIQHLFALNQFCASQQSK